MKKETPSLLVNTDGAKPLAKYIQPKVMIVKKGGKFWRQNYYTDKVFRRSMNNYIWRKIIERKIMYRQWALVNKSTATLKYLLLTNFFGT